MKGKSRCPHCKESVVVDVPDGLSGEQVVTCPNCGMKFKVNVDEKYSWESEAPMIHPSVHLKTRSMKPAIAGILLIITLIFGVILSAAIFSSVSLIESAHIDCTFKGKVVDDNGNPLEGVTVSLLNHPEISNVTNDKGKFSLSNITAGKQTLHLTKEGYKTTNIKVIVLPQNIESEKFVMEEGSGEVSTESLSAKILINYAFWISSLVLVMSIITGIGGIASLMRKYFPMTVIGSVTGFFTIVGIPLGIIALVLLLISKDEFESEPKEVKY